MKHFVYFVNIHVLCAEIYQFEFAMMTNAVRHTDSFRGDDPAKPTLTEHAM